jgi:hypothetical protein
MREMTDCELIRELAIELNTTATDVASLAGVDPRDYINGADCRPEAVKVLTDPWLWLSLAAVLAGAFLVRKYRVRLMALKNRITLILNTMPLYKKVVGVGAGLFLLACLFVPLNSISHYSSGTQRSFDGFHFIFNLPNYGNREIAWPVLAVELLAILVVTGLLAYVVKDSD